MSIEHSCLPYGLGGGKKRNASKTYKKGDTVTIKIIGNITAKATLVRDPYVSNLGHECVCVKIDGVEGDKYIFTKEIVEHDEKV